MRGTTALLIVILVVCAPRIARSGPTTGDAVPLGSYVQTCGAISYDPASTTLTATCAPRSPQQSASTVIAEATGFGPSTLSPVTTSLQVSYCDPAADIDNVNAHLQCKALAGTWGQGGAVPNGSYQESCQYWSVTNGAQGGGAMLNAQCWTYARGAIDYFATGSGAWASAQLDLTQCSMSGDIQNDRGQLLCQTAPAAPPPPPGPPQNLRTSNNGSGILVSWANPPGVLKATVSRTPVWPSATATMNIAPPRDSLQDELAVTGQAYAYNVCLSFQTGVSCAPVAAKLPSSAPPAKIPQHLMVGAVTAAGQQSPSPTPGPLNPPRALNEAAAEGQTGSSVCQPGFVWRQAYASDEVCVTPQARDQAAADNLAAPTRQAVSGQCISGYVWRQASPQDHVCVTAQTREQTAQENASGAAKVAR